MRDESAPSPATRWRATLGCAVAGALWLTGCGDGQPSFEDELLARAESSPESITLPARDGVDEVYLACPYDALGKAPSTVRAATDDAGRDQTDEGGQWIFQLDGDEVLDAERLRRDRIDLCGSTDDVSFPITRTFRVESGGSRPGDPYVLAPR